MLKALPYLAFPEAVEKRANAEFTFGVQFCFQMRCLPAYLAQARFCTNSFAHLFFASWLAFFGGLEALPAQFPLVLSKPKIHAPFGSLADLASFSYLCSFG